MDLLFDKNLRVVLAACELMSNLSISTAIQQLAMENDDNQDGQDEPINSTLNRDITHLLIVLRKASEEGSDINDEAVYKGFLRAILGFFANLICCSSIRLLLRKENKGRNFVNDLMPSFLRYIGEECQNDESNVTPNMDIVHRIVFIADEYLREDELNFITGKEEIQCLKYFFK